MAKNPERLDLTPARQRAVIALFQQRQRVVEEANRVLSEIQSAIDELAALYADEAGWEFAQDESGVLYLRPRESEEKSPPE